MKADFGDGRQFIWLASYPKSGNTWLRSMLAALAEPDRPLDLGALPYGMELFDRQLLDDFAAISSGEMHAAELVPYQARMFAAMAQEAEAPIIAKTHCAAFNTESGGPLFSPEVCAGAIYLYRDPLDVVVSFAHHDGKSVDEIIERMNDPEAVLHQWSYKGTGNLPQFMGRWRDHLASWAGGTGFPVLMLRYEDMLCEPSTALGSVAQFCDWEATDEAIERAVAKCRFDRLALAEQDGGFIEKPSADRPFFRSGRSGDGERILSPDQIEKLSLDRSVYLCHSATPNNN